MDLKKIALFSAVVLAVLIGRRAFGGRSAVIDPLPLESQVMRHSGLIWSAGRKYNVEPALIAAIMAAESSGINQRPRLIPVAGGTSTDYVVGLMQIRLDTAIAYCEIWNKEGLESVPANVECGTRYLRYLIDRFGLVDRAVSAYNVGPGAVNIDPSVPVIFTNTTYVRKVLGMIPRFRILFMSAQGGSAYLDLFPGWRWRYQTP